MKHVSLALFLAVMLVGISGAQAQDTIGLFFDDQGVSTEIVTLAPNQVVPAWLLLLNPSQSGGVAGWECEVAVNSDGPSPFVIWEVQGEYINFGTPPFFSVGVGTPLPPGVAVVLAKATVIVPDPAHEISFSIRPYDPPSLVDTPGSGYPVQQPSYVSGGDGNLYPLQSFSGCTGQPVAHINTNGVDPVSQLTGVPHVLYFGSGPVGSTATETFLISNPDTLPVIGEVQLAMEGASYRHGTGAFTIAPTTFRIGSQGRLQFCLAFVLPAAGLYDGQLTITLCGQDYVVALHGGGSLNCMVLPPLLDFGDVPVGAVVSDFVTLHNYGDYTIDATPHCAAECAPLTWALVDSTVDPTHLVPNGSMNIQVTYQPVVPARDVCTLIFGGDLCGSVTVSGQAWVQPPACEVSAMALDFGDVVQDSLRVSSLVITNTGGGHLIGEAVVVDPAGVFTIVAGGGAFDLTFNQTRQVEVAFLPAAVGSYIADLDFGTDCTSVSLVGQGAVGVPTYYNVLPVKFGIREFGRSHHRLISVRNTGLVTLNGDLQISGDPSCSVAEPGPFVVAPGHYWQSYVYWQPIAYGPVMAQISTGLPNGEIVPVTGFGVEVTPYYNKNELGFSFDTSGNQTCINTEPGTTVTGYLWVDTPTAPIGGWELNLLFAGDAQPLNWFFNGVASGDLGPSRFQVMLDSPLPPATIVLLANVDILVPLAGETSILATSLGDGEIPGWGSYVDGDDPGNHLPLLKTQGQQLASINPTPLGIDGPAAPTARIEGGAVVLNWTCEVETIDGYNVYRRLGTGKSVRLTAVPVICEQGFATFTDHPQVVGGTVVAYMLTRVTDGMESSPSVALEITLENLLPVKTRLLASYPNPFNPQTTVPFEMARRGHARLAVYDAAGKLVRVLADEEVDAGRAERVWLGRDARGQRVPSGVYYLRLETENNVALGKILLLK